MLDLPFHDNDDDDDDDNGFSYSLLTNIWHSKDTYSSDSRASVATKSDRNDNQNLITQCSSPPFE